MGTLEAEEREGLKPGELVLIILKKEVDPKSFPRLCEKMGPHFHSGSRLEGHPWSGYELMLRKLRAGDMMSMGGSCRFCPPGSWGDFTWNSIVGVSGLQKPDCSVREPRKQPAVTSYLSLICGVLKIYFERERKGAREKHPWEKVTDGLPCAHPTLGMELTTQACALLMEP